MRVIKFELSGRTAHFKRPDVNVSTYFTYHHIHKVALLGILGAIIGLKGYNEQDKNSDFPEFYEKLMSLSIAILPISKYNGIFSKKIQVFNNSVGYASQENGNNLIVREQWLENPRWKIYISLESDIEPSLLSKLEYSLLNNQTVYVPYLGKNDHFADIANVELLELNEVDNPDYISSLFVWEDVILEQDTVDYESPYTFKDTVPCSLNNLGMYEFKRIGLTNRMISSTNNTLYFSEEKNLYFM